MASHRIHMLLDRSGSMGAYRAQTIEAVNAYLATLRADGLARDTSFNLTIFDSESIDTIRRDEPGWQVRNLEQREFEPRSATPLYDAVGHVLELEGSTPISGRRAIVIVTDGAENGSRRLNEAAVREMAASREAQGWIMIFLGANQNAAVEAAKVGVPAQRAIAYRAGSGKAAAATFAAAAALSFGYFMLKPGDANAASSLGFSEGDRQTAFDGAADWEAEMFKDMGSAPTEPPAGPSPAAITESPPADADAPADPSATASSASDSDPDPGDSADSGGSLLDTITGALGSLFSSFGGGGSDRDSNSDGGSDGGGGDGGGGGD
jgi:uncharacterized membrane protein YgcG